MPNESDPTVKELIDQAIEYIGDRRECPVGPATTQSAREFSLAITALEDAQMRYTRGRAIELGKFKPADLDREVQDG